MRSYYSLHKYFSRISFSTLTEHNVYYFHNKYLFTVRDKLGKKDACLVRPNTQGYYLGYHESTLVLHH